LSSKINILVIDDEVQIRKLLDITLRSEGYGVLFAENGREGVEKAASHRPGLIILDLGLPDEDGQSVLRKIRSWSRTPIIILSVRNSENEIISSLDAGADDYVTKPFNTQELLARIRVALRHSLPIETLPVFVNGPLTIDLNSRTVLKDNIEVKLTAKEYSLLILFIKNAGKVITHSHILRDVWGNAFSDETQYVRIYMAQLRKKLEDNPDKPRMFITESGIGYRMKVIE
jgi:two-component system KDP operon response regulator KdpE